MERGNPSSQSGQEAKSGTNVTQTRVESSTNKGAETESSTNNDNTAPYMRDKNHVMPIAKVTKIMQDILPESAKVSDEAKGMIQKCVSEFIGFITGEANEHCLSEQRQIVSPEDLIFALKSLGFDDFVEPLTCFLDRYRKLEGDS